MTLQIQINDAVRTDGLRLLHQSKKGFVEPLRIEGANADFLISIDLKEGVWGGPSVHKYGDKRPFIYFAWLDGMGRIAARIKLYQDQVPAGIEKFEVEGKGKNGTPACSTAVLVFR